ncbi:MAG: MBOAT family protein [Clostridiales bacterium]|nr:MBOAT family protein [Clostridiales bacterium]
MLFSSVTFLYYFLPVALILYYAAPAPNGGTKWRNLALLAVSFVFYAWGEPVYSLLMAAEIAVLWALGLLIERFRGTPWSKAFLVLSLAVGLGALMYFKYANFFAVNVSALFGADFNLRKLALPIGISFYTFQTLSYSIDLYRGKARVQRNILIFAAYVTLFPQLIAGPIVRYTDVAESLGRRGHSAEQFASGAARFSVGLAKKALLSNTLGQLSSLTRAVSERSALSAWVYAVAYGLHLYFDFSGYSDMAIGLGRMFGFEFLENFNYPYTARSVTDFWRRWHISLSSWFRDYVYFPLGGNRVAPWRHVVNILVVWTLTGFWHGADWQFLFWGLYFGVLLVAEKYFLAKPLARAPAFVGYIYALLAVLVSWVIFDAPSGPEAFAQAGRMFGIGVRSAVDAESLYYLRSYAAPLIVGIIGATPLPKRVFARLSERFGALQPVLIAAALVVCTAFLVDGSFNPFIYFRF